LREIRNKSADLLERQIANVKLERKAGTASKTRVLIESSDGKREWGNRRRQRNIIEASLQALVGSNGICVDEKDLTHIHHAVYWAHEKAKAIQVSEAKKFRNGTEGSRRCL